MAAAGQPQVDLQLLGLVVLLGKEVAVGLMIGFATATLFAAADAAGEIIGYDSGLALATIFDPDTGQTNPMMGEFLNVVFLLVFLLMNGHHFVLQALQLSYHSVPIGGLSFSGALLGKMMGLGSMVVVVAVKFAAPLIVASFLINIALAVLARVAPQMNVFIVSFPLKVGVGFIVMMASAPMIVYVFKKLLTGFEENILELVKVM